MACGRTLAPVEVAYTAVGPLAPDGANVVVVCHALTGDAHAAGPGGWWAAMVGPGRPVDTTRFHVICANLLGGCQGTTGPSSVDPATGARYGMTFPPIAVSDLVAVQRRLLAHLQIDRVHAAIGGSLGGMQVLQWLLDAPGEIRHAVMVGASAELTAENIAFSAVARAAILGSGEGGRAGMAVARRLAHITYLSEAALQQRFGRALAPGAEADPADAVSWLGTRFEVESYLDHQAEVFLDRFDPLTYLWLTRVMDGFAPLADTPAAAAALAAQPGLRTLVISFDSDWRFSTAHARRLADGLRGAGAAHVEQLELAGPRGHDSFLLEVPGYQSAVAAFIG